MNSLRMMISILLLSAGLAAVAAEPPKTAAAPRLNTIPGAIQVEQLGELVDRAAALLPVGRSNRMPLPPDVSDPALREAVLQLWLDRIAADPLLSDIERTTLQGLIDYSPSVWIEHHEAGGHAMPAFAVAMRARALLDFDQRAREANWLAERPGALLAQLQSAPGDDALAVAQLAIERLTPKQRRELAAQLIQQPASRARDRAALTLARLSAEHEPLLTWGVAHAGLSEARQALQLAIELSSPELPELVKQAAARPELGGLVVEAHVLAGAAVETLWTWLDDPELGADASRVLAARPGLAAEVEARIGTAPPRARLRMLLALKLSKSADARALLAQLADAEWLQPAQREVLRQWQ